MNECQEDIGKEVLGNKPEVDVTNNAEVKVSKINEKVKNATNNITNKILLLLLIAQQFLAMVQI